MPTDGTLSISTAPTVAIDPGARWVGLCARVGRDVVDASTVGRDDDGSNPQADRLWIEKRLARIDELMARHAADVGVSGEWRIAVETVAQPKAFAEGRRVPASPRVGWHVAGAMLVYGAVLAAWPSAVIVAPAHRGERHLARWGGSGAAATRGADRPRRGEVVPVHGASRAGNAPPRRRGRRGRRTTRRLTRQHAPPSWVHNTAYAALEPGSGRGCGGIGVTRHSSTGDSSHRHRTRPAPRRLGVLEGFGFRVSGVIGGVQAVLRPSPGRETSENRVLCSFCRS